MLRCSSRGRRGRRPSPFRHDHGLEGRRPRRLFLMWCKNPVSGYPWDLLVTPARTSGAATGCRSRMLRRLWDWAPVVAMLFARSPRPATLPVPARSWAGGTPASASVSNVVQESSEWLPLGLVGHSSPDIRGGYGMPKQDAPATLGLGSGCCDAFRAVAEAGDPPRSGTIMGWRDAGLGVCF